VKRCGTVQLWAFLSRHAEDLHGYALHPPLSSVRPHFPSLLVRNPVPNPIAARLWLRTVGKSLPLLRLVLSRRRSAASARVSRPGRRLTCIRFLVVRHGKLVYEQYFTGADEKLGRPAGIVSFDATTKHDLRSIEKSVAALVLGIVITQGRMADIDQPLLAQFPEYVDLRSTQKDQITLRHLLTMSQGLAWNEDIPYSDPANSENQMDVSPDPVRYAFSPPVVAPPGTVWNYSTGSTTILAALLHKATGQR